ncbi:MAG TPA: GAF domain-containing sensor histidine kinase [Patescibacteria group bacterium]|nr:GAF domain-containing sensor histidine kinase [Patescibacteria group bacterium]
MIGSDYLINLLGLSSILIIITLVITLAFKLERINRMQTTVDNLKRSLDEMDEQAQLIVRTDVELNKTQEELDKKVSGLYALQRLSREISTTMEENQIFQRISLDHLEDLGFEKACAFLWNEKEKKFTPYLNIGYAEEDLKLIKSSIDTDKHTYLDLIKNQNTVSSLRTPPAAGFKDKINRVFKSIYYVISPILPKEGSRGFLLVGTANTDVLITEGDEELITILANQIGQSLENSRLFENTWRAQQELEKKVEERTRALSQALEEVKVVSKRKNDFISAVSHELRTPLTSIKGFAAILLDEKLGALPTAVKERLEKINIRSDELVHMVNDLLDIARIEAGKTVMKFEEQDIYDVINSVCDLIMIQCKNKNVELAVEPTKNVPKLLIDRSQVERVFINLLGNAVKFTPTNGKITIKTHVKDGAVQVDISDTGIGIPPEAIPKLFQEFYRVDTAAHQQLKGTGLGLSLVKHIIDAHKGKIWVESIPDKGSTFSFTLPLTS